MKNDCSHQDLSPSIERRHFVGVTVASLAAMALPAFPRPTKPCAKLDSLATPQLSMVFTGSGEIGALGRLYRQHAPNESNAKVLVVQLLRTAGESCADLGLALAETIREDFRSGNTVQLSGWMLSRTEARQCALYSLLHG